MPRLDILVRSRPDIKGLVGQCMLTKPQMAQLGAYADEIITKRVDSATPQNVFGETRPDLSPSYKRRKMREGRRGVRDMRRTGKTLAAMKVIRTDQKNGEVSAVVGFDNSQAYKKALFNQNIDPWFSLNDPDPNVIGFEEEKVITRAADLFEFNVRKVNGR
jgi:hypothetical protein